MNNPLLEPTKHSMFETIAKMTGVSIEELFLDSSVKTIFKGNVHKLGVVLYDLHELTDKQVDYAEEEITKKFITIQDMATYFELN